MSGLARARYKARGLEASVRDPVPEHTFARLLERRIDDNDTRISGNKRCESHWSRAMQGQKFSSSRDVRFLWSPADAVAQLWDTPPLPPVKYSPAPDGMTVSVGAEQVHVSVCRSAVMHFVANPEPSNAIRQNQPWMLDSKESCPGAKF